MVFKATLHPMVWHLILLNKVLFSCLDHLIINSVILITDLNISLFFLLNRDGSCDFISKPSTWRPIKAASAPSSTHPVSVHSPSAELIVILWVSVEAAISPWRLVSLVVNHIVKQLLLRPFFHLICVCVLGDDARRPWKWWKFDQISQDSRSFLLLFPDRLHVHRGEISLWLARQSAPAAQIHCLPGCLIDFVVNVVKTIGIAGQQNWTHHSRKFSNKIN